jgi:hypothetical protein
MHLDCKALAANTRHQVTMIHQNTKLQDSYSLFFTVNICIVAVLLEGGRKV